MNERLCIFCKHFYLDTGSQGWSEYTPGSDFYMQCKKDRWKFVLGDSEQSYRLCIIAADTCEDYEFNESLRNER